MSSSAYLTRFCSFICACRFPWLLLQDSNLALQLTLIVLNLFISISVSSA